jgi:4-amino-4-deoxy-L-arabinose transferase-like glycosyltransferase
MKAMVLPAAASLSTLPTAVLVGLAALVVVELALDVVALVDLYRRPSERVVGENKWLWVAIIVLVSLFGAIIYLAAGRKPALADDAAVAAPVRPSDIVDSLYGPRDDTAQK